MLVKFLPLKLWLWKLAPKGSDAVLPHNRCQKDTTVKEACECKFNLRIMFGYGDYIEMLRRICR